MPGAPVLLAAAVCAAYSNTLHAPFIFDDAVNILLNKSIRALWPLWRVLAGDAQTGVAGRPLVNLSFALNHAVSGTNPWSYHALNICIHIVAALTLMGLIQLTLCLEKSGAFQKDAAPLAFLCALVWALHPLNTVAVTYVTQRLESLMGLFFLLTFYCAARGWQSAKKGAWHAASVLACILGMLCKEVMVTAPFLVFAYDAVFVHPDTRVREILGRSKGLYAGLALALVVLAALLATGHTWDTAYEDKAQLGVMRYALAQPGVILHLLRLAAWPDALCLDYGYAIWNLDKSPAPTPIYVALYGAGLAALAGLILPSLWKRRAWGFVLAWFFGILAPTSSFVPLRCFCEEHRMYLPSAALAMAVVLAGYKALANRAAKKAGVVLALVLALALGTAAYVRNHDFSSSLLIWTGTLKKCPSNARAAQNLGLAFNAAQRYALALPYFERALAGGEKPYKAHIGMGMALAGQGEHLRALEHFQKALDERPDLDTAHQGMAVSLAALGRYEQAILHYKVTLALDPDAASVYHGLAFALAQTGRMEQARACLKKASILENAMKKEP